jgi:hypothetical protein
MRLKFVMLALAVGLGSPGFGQTSPTSQPAPRPHDANPVPGNPDSAKAGTGSDTRQRAPDDKSDAGGTTTGAAAPNLTGSSNSSGINGVDSSTSNSH